MHCWKFLTPPYHFCGSREAAPWGCTPVHTWLFVVMFQSDLLVLFSEALQRVIKALWVQEIVVPGKGAAG